MADIKTIDDENFAGKKVLVRVDFNAPVDADGNVTDDTRIRAALPTINKLVGDGARVILTSHRGRPAGEGFEESFSLGPIARRLQELLGRDIVLSRELIGPAAQEAVDALDDGDVLLLENIRFDKREKKNDPEFARALADLADAYANDAFGTAHRAHASTAGVAAYLPSYAGYLMERDWLELVDVAVCPPFVDLKPVKSVFEFDRVDIAVGAQNIYWEPSGAFTGEISIPMIKNIGCAFCIVGHSERRNLFGETNEEVNLKARALIEADITPIICVGESLSVRDGGTYLDFVTAQVRAAYAGMDAADAARTVVAYEPVWAIGTGRTATPEQAEEVCAAIRATVSDMFGAEVAENLRVLYGGSMNEGNAALLLAEPDIDGGLIGGAALKADSFIQIVKEAC